VQDRRRGDSIDGEGKTIVDTPGAGSGEPPGGWYLSKIAQAESLRRSMVVVNNIEPVRLRINEMVAIEERHFNPIVGQSHFVPRLQAPLYALGFARFFQGDFASAAHLLIPQLEPSLRHILKASGADPIKRRDDATEEDRSLDAIITNHRAELISGYLGSAFVGGAGSGLQYQARPCASPRRCSWSVVGRSLLFSRRHLRLLASVSCLLSVFDETMGRVGAPGPGDRGARPMTVHGLPSG
jgi:hypothetical protein